jgi:hypothetical protein
VGQGSSGLGMRQKDHDASMQQLASRKQDFLNEEPEAEKQFLISILRGVSRAINTLHSTES